MLEVSVWPASGRQFTDGPSTDKRYDICSDARAAGLSFLFGVLVLKGGTSPQPRIEQSGVKRKVGFVDMLFQPAAFCCVGRRLEGRLQPKHLANSKGTSFLST